MSASSEKGIDRPSPSSAFLELPRMADVSGRMIFQVVPIQSAFFFMLHSGVNAHAVIRH
jgi:hypothetical protein